MHSHHVVTSINQNSSILLRVNSTKPHYSWILTPMSNFCTCVSCLVCPSLSISFFVCNKPFPSFHTGHCDPLRLWTAYSLYICKLQLKTMLPFMATISFHLASLSSTTLWTPWRQIFLISLYSQHLQKYLSKGDKKNTENDILPKYSTFKIDYNLLTLVSSMLSLIPIILLAHN